MTTLMLRRTVPVVFSCAVAIGMTTAPNAGAASATAVDVTKQACYETDGYPPDGGRSTGEDPVRYKWDNTPYIGARYSSCGRVARIYYGGYTTNTTHYNVRWAPPGGSWRQTELGPGARQVWTISAAWGDYNFMVQACNRGGIFQQSRCTNWSPQLYLNTR
ncbi:hypothetical protein GCM10010260_10170 [Streptomyces filipinensis]|uniref:Secreted protein n=1 Tax=Streptomyces filipinensis TaxID=66887 RepID=A0A918I6S8_9ACTN|nr:hypothetical protein [Streptomyces filipinensis]GGU79980.1 hypothetical protein GCM10010260_10170 [Streptomyces filipinensis]